VRPALAFAALSLAACASPGALGVELGTGETGFTPIEAEPALPLVAGPQGGHHVWVSLRVEAASTERVDLTLDALPLDGPEPPRRPPGRVRLDPMPDGRSELIGWPAELTDPGCAIGHRVRLRATVEDRDGSTGTDERMIVIAPGRHPPDC